MKPKAPRLPRSLSLSGWLIGAGCALIASACFGVWNSPRARRLPAPHVIPISREASSLRLAMIHDVFVEHGERRSSAWHEARLNKRRQDILNHEPSEKAPFAAYDDAIVSCIHVHHFAEGDALARQQLALINTPPPNSEAVTAALAAIFNEHSKIRLTAMEMEPTEENLIRYRCYANLGTLLAHQALFDRADDPDGTLALSRLEEAKLWIGRALALNAGAHFGRETWQFVAIESVLAWQQDPTLRERYDLIGQPLAMTANHDLAQGRLISGSLRYSIYGRQLLLSMTPSGFDPGHLSLLDARSRARLRDAITPVASDRDWQSVTGSHFIHAVPFDEPVLGLIGMWWFGGGANPYSAMTLAHICERIGQARLAWEGYARARVEIAKMPDLKLRQALDETAARHQERLLAYLRDHDARWTTDHLQSAFDAELTAGHSVINELHAYEMQSLAAGADVDDPTWLDDWQTTHPTITTAPGAEDWIVAVHTGGNNRLNMTFSWIFSGLIGLIAVKISEWIFILRVNRLHRRHRLS